MKLSKLGWILTAAMVGLAIGGGFQTKSEKAGFVDMQAVFADSNLKFKNDKHLSEIEQARIHTLDSLSLYPGFNADQLARFHALSIKETLTPAETTELAKLKADAQTASTQFATLREKQNPTPQEVATLNDLGARSTLDATTRVQWGREFDQELRTLQSKLNAQSSDILKAAVAQVAAKQALTLVFRENCAIYGSRDLGPEVKKIAEKNAK